MRATPKITAEDVLAIYHRPFPDLIAEAIAVHRANHDPRGVQRATLLSIKTGGCQENCAYCPQSAHYDTPVQRQSLMSVEEVKTAAFKAKQQGADRFCMGAAWREVKDGPEFDRVLEMVSEVRGLGMEACVTLGMLNESQAQRLKEAGLTAYNHNLDSSEEFYSKVITTRTYDDRLKTLGHVREAGLSVCCGGIVGMGESVNDRVQLLATLASFDPQPESVPINSLVQVEGTPLHAEHGGKSNVDALDIVRMVATARILMPKARVRLSAGRMAMSDEAQALCFLAGANSIFYGEKLLTTENPDFDHDAQLLARLGMRNDSTQEKTPGLTPALTPDHGKAHAAIC